MHDINWKAKRERRQEIKEHVRRFLLFPSFWEDPTKLIANDLKWRKIKFANDNSLSIPTKKGIYCFVVIPPIENKLFITRYLMYVGKASSATLRSRYKNYIDEMNNIGIGDQKPRIKIQEMLNDYYNHIYFFYSELTSATEIIETEMKLLNTFMPYVNTSIPELQISEEYRHIY